MALFKVAPLVSPRNQQTSSTCWLTCLEMLFQWKRDQGDSQKDPSNILNLMNASPNLFPEYMRDNGIAPVECKETAKALGLRWGGDCEIDPVVLFDLMAQRGPVWIAGMWRMNYSHVILITGVDKDSGAITYADPWMNNSLTESRGTMLWLNNRGSVWKNCDASVMYF